MHTSEALLYLILIIIAARVGGEMAERFRQPTVLGEIVAGIGLGLIPAIHPAADNEAIVFIAEIGVVLLLFEVGLESEFEDFLKVGAPAALVAVIGVVLPLFVGLGVIYVLGYTIYEALFLGATLTATSVGITARVLSDLRQSQSAESKIIIGAAVVDDILGLLVLSVVLGLAAGAAVSVGRIAFTLGLAVAFLVLSIVIGLRAAPLLLGLVAGLRGRGIIAVVAFTFGLVVAYLGSLLGLAPIVGAFAAGLVLASTEHRLHITERIEPVGDIFVPVFFAWVGMQVNLSLLADWTTIGLAVVLLLIAVPTKLVAGLGAVKQRVDKLTVGIGMVPRGEVGLIFASLGITNNILSEGVYGAIVVVVLATTLVTPPWLKHRLGQLRGRDEGRGR